jgi:hypothetical protein
VRRGVTVRMFNPGWAAILAAVLPAAGTGEPAGSVPSSTTPPTTTSAAAPAGSAGQSVQPIDVGLAALELLEPATSGVGSRPTFRWSAVPGASSYLLAIVTAENEPVWAWQGVATEVVLGGWDEVPPAGAPGPVLGGASSWFVVALDAQGLPLANSGLRPVAP